VITGAASGIGFATAARLADAGLKLCLVDRDEVRLREVATDLGTRSDVRAECLDVSDPEAVNRLGDSVERHFGAVDVLMNNAGIGGGGDALSNPEGWRRVLGVNLMGVLHGVQRFVPAMLASDRPGLVINTGSKQGITQPPGDTAYNLQAFAQYMDSGSLGRREGRDE
jgi:NADP-dependent 3-hydroxy acid dehydrogenase YdfG